MAPLPRPNSQEELGGSTVIEYPLDLQDGVSKAHVSELVGERFISPRSRNKSSDALAAFAASHDKDYQVPVTNSNRLRPLHCAAQEYAWGRIGSNSMVARMKAAQDEHIDDSEPNFQIDESTPYAELWLGTHPNGMSKVSLAGSPEGATTLTLLDYVRSDPELHCGCSKADDLTFLFKVLSINKTLSIQAHPDKILAEQLNDARPNVYKDPNHKPEMAVVLSDEMKAMCGFRPIMEIAENLRRYPELAALVGKEATAEVMRRENTIATRGALRDMFKHYLESPQGEVQKQVDSLLSRLHDIDEADLDEIQKLMLELSEQFPGDAGIFAPLIFNVLTMTEGQAFFIDANEPHAYISGEILECMACSDNVVRAGLTPKLKDVETLVSMLTYKSFKPDITRGMKIDNCMIRYQPPVSDFAIELITVPPNQSYEIKDVRSPSVLLTLNGTANLRQGNVTNMPVSFGSAAFASANTQATVVAGSEGVRIARALTNVYHNDYLWSGGSWEMNNYLYDDYLE